MTNLKYSSEISVIIAMHNEEKAIGLCIDSFLKQTIDKNKYELIIIDGESTDKSKEVVEGYIHKNLNFKILLLKNTQKIQAAGWNIGFKYSKAKYVVMMGAHTVVEPDFLEKNLALHIKYDVPCTGGIVQAKGENEISKAIALAFNSPFGAGNAKYWYGTKTEKVETVAYGMYKREVFDKVGYIDENIVRGQDWELNYRITKKFGKFVFSPEIKSFYYARSSLINLWKRQFGSGFWKIYIIKKHPDSMLIRHVIPMLFALTLICTVLYGFLFGLWLPFGVLSLSYMSIDFFSAWSVLRDNTDKLFTKIIITYFVMHFGYGLGAIFGLFKMLFVKSKD